MRQVSILILSLTILNVSFRYVSILAIFHLRSDYIAQTLCENRFDPSEMCQGRCYLQKELEEAAENLPDQNASIQTLLLPVSWYVSSGVDKIHLSPTPSKSFVFSCWKDPFSGFEFLHDIDHPPERTT